MYSFWIVSFFEEWLRERLVHANLDLRSTLAEDEFVASLLKLVSHSHPGHCWGFSVTSTTFSDSFVELMR